MIQMMHSAYDEKRILDWIAHQPTDKHFTRDTVTDQLAPISFSLVDYVLSHEVKRGSIRKSGLTGRYYVKKESNNMNDTEKRLKDLETKYKRLEDIVAKDTETVNIKLRNWLLDVEALAKKNSNKVNAMPDKKPRLWSPWVNSQFSEAPRDIMVDVMLADGEVLINMRADQISWKYISDAPSINVIAWRHAE